MATRLGAAVKGPALYRAARLAQAMPVLVSGVVLLSLGHLAYVGVNLAAFLDARVERLVLLAYPIGMLTLAWLFLRRLWKPTEAPALYLERRHDFGWRLLNAERGLSGETPEQVLAPLHAKDFWTRRPWRTWAIGASFPLLLLVGHAVTPGLTGKFLANVSSLFGSRTPRVTVTAPAWVLEGAEAAISWQGEGESARLSLAHGKDRQEMPLPAGQIHTVASVTETLAWSLEVRSGRSRRLLTGTTGVHRKPRLASLSVHLVDPVGRTEGTTGVTALAGWAGSRVTWQLIFETNQVLAAADGVPEGVTAAMDGNRLVLSQPNLPAGEQAWSLRVSNARGQWAEAPVVLRLSGRANGPPTVTLDRGPGAEIAFHLRAGDDLGLRSVKLLKVGAPDAVWSRDLNTARDHEETVTRTEGDLGLKPGEQATFVAEAEDALGLTARSGPLVIRRAGALERTEAGLAKVDSLEKSWAGLVEQSKRLERAREEMRLLAERGQLTAEKLTAIKDMGEQLRTQARDMAAALDTLQKAREKQDALMADPEVSRRLKDLSEALKQLDEQTLKQIDSMNRSLMEQAARQGLDPETLKRATEQMTAAKVAARLENLKAALESLKRAQTLEDLAKIADGLYQKGQDLRSKSLRQGAPEPWNRARPDLARELADLAEAWKARRDQAAPKGRDAVTDGLRNDVDQSMDQAGQELSKDLSGSDPSAELSRQTRTMDRLRRALQSLARSERGADQAAWMEEARRQLLASLTAASSAQIWSRGEAMDPQAARDVKRLEAARTLAESQAWVEGSRLALSAHLAPSMPHLLPELDAWREVESFLKSQARRLDPSLGTPGAAVGPDAEVFRQARSHFLGLAARLEALMKRSEQNPQDGKDGGQGMEGLSQAQSRLGRRAGEQLGPGQGNARAQDEYLRELAGEQAMLREMLARMGSTGKGPGEGGPESPGGKEGGRGEGEALMRELNEQMKKAEEALAMGGSQKERILATQKAIEANMLKATRGMKERKDEETEERESRGGTNTAARPGDRAFGNRSTADEKWRSLEGAPDAWATRMKAFLDSKRESATTP